MPRGKYEREKNTDPCKVCGKEYDETDFRGRKCHSCYKLGIKEWCDNNKEHLAELNKRNRKMATTLKEPKTLTPKEPKKEKSIHEQLEEYKQREERRKQTTRNSNFKAKIRNYLKKHPEVHIRPPVKKNPDRFIYESNDTWGIDNNYYLNVDDLMTAPLEHFDVEHWYSYYLNLSVEMETYIEKRNYDKMLEDNQRWNCSYTKPDKEYGRDENGKLIRMYPIN